MWRRECGRDGASVERGGASVGRGGETFEKGGGECKGVVVNGLDRGDIWDNDD